MMYYFVGLRGIFVRELKILLIYTMEHLLVCLVVPVHFVADEETWLLKLKENRAVKVRYKVPKETPGICWAYILPLVPNCKLFRKLQCIFSDLVSSYFHGYLNGLELYILVGLIPVMQLARFYNNHLPE